MATHPSQHAPYSDEDIAAILDELNATVHGHDRLRAWSTGPGVHWDWITAGHDSDAVGLIGHDASGARVVLRRIDDHWERA